MTLGANIAGREAELAELRGLLDAVQALPRGSLIVGEPGIGKTTLWRGAIDTAQARGYRVLEAAPVETEAAFGYAALGDLLGGALDEALPELSEPQARALRIALLLDEPRGRRPEPRAIALGVLGVLRALGRSGPILVAVDDAHWLDTSSTAALAFAVRRLRDEPVALVLAERPGGGPRLSDALAEERLLRIELGPLSVGALHRVLRDRLGRSYPRPFLHRLRQASGGNPLHALEIARQLAGAEMIAAGESLPVPPGLEELLRRRLSALPPDTTRVLAAASLHAQPTVAALDAVSGNTRERLQPALEAGIVRLDGERVRFTHPLFASTIAASLNADQRRELHRRLAAIVADVEQRVRHLALGANEPAAATALEIDRGAAAASARGAPDAAAELYVLAARFTPPEAIEAARARRLLAADAYTRAGSADQARALLEEILQELPAGSGRAELLLRLVWVAPDIDHGMSLLEQALTEAAGDPRLQARSHAGLSGLKFGRGEAGEAHDHIRAASELAPEMDEIVASRVLYGTLAGDRVPEVLLDRVQRLAAAGHAAPTFLSPNKVLGVYSLCAGRMDEARKYLEAYLRQASEHADEWLYADAVHHLGEAEWRGGRWDQADRYARELLELAEQLGEESEWPKAQYAGAVVAAGRGHVDAARASAEKAATDAGRRHAELLRAMSVGVLGFVELSLGNAGAAAAVLFPLADQMEEAGYRQPVVPDVRANAVEAAVATAELDRARTIVGQLEQRALVLEQPAAEAAAARSRGLLAAAEGDLAAADAALRRALAAHERAQLPLDRGRTLQILGVVQRRAKERAAARATLTEALDVFETLGAQLWAQRAREALDRIGRRAASPEALTTAEERIAILVAEGKSNKDIASELFISVHTVEAALTRVYSKVGVRSRTQLARALTGRGAGDAEKM